MFLKSRFKYLNPMLADDAERRYSKKWRDLLATTTTTAGVLIEKVTAGNLKSQVIDGTKSESGDSRVSNEKSGERHDPRG